jgi:hypothetical protein
LGVGSVGRSADGGSADTYGHTTPYGRATVNTGTVRASVMNTNAANTGTPTAIGKGII